MSNDNIKNYLLNRVKRDDYRGIHLAQHNRLPEEKLVAILAAIHSAVGVESFGIPPGDDPNPTRTHNPKAERHANGYDSYYDILDAISLTTVAGVSATFNSLKKNHFPNFEGMGLLLRSVDSQQDDRAYTARLSDKAVNIIDAGQSRNRTLLIGEATESLIGKQFIDDLHHLLTQVDMLNVYELMLVVSDPGLSLPDKEKLIREYRKLKAIQRIKMHSDVKNTCEPTMALSKKERRDWHNWWNESRQILTMLSTVAGFNVYNQERIMLAGSADTAYFDNSRSATIKRLAFDWQGITPREGWELHHIYPIEYATCSKDMELIDAVENLLYIPAAKHRTIPNSGNMSVQFSYDSSQVILVNPVSKDNEPKFVFLNPSEVAIKGENLETMRKYSEKLLRSVS
jgi:hypothetical protein